MPTPSQAAIDMLRKNPDSASQFDEVFGAGSSKQYLQQPTSTGILGTAGAIASDIGTGITEAPRAIVRGVENAANETSNTTKEVADGIQDFAAKHGVDLGHIQYDFTHGAPKVWWAPGKYEGPNNLQVPQSVTPDAPTSTTGKLEEGVAQFTAGMWGAGKFLKAFGVGGAATSTLGKFAEMSGKAAMADATVFDPHADRLSNLVQSYPALQNPVTDFLAAKPDDSAAMGRFKNSLEGFLTGTALEGLTQSVKAIKLARNGDLKGAAEAAQSVPEAAPETAPAQGHAFPEGDSRNGPAALTISPEGDTKAATEAAPAAAEGGQEAAPTSNEAPADQAEAKPEAAPAAGEQTAPSAGEQTTKPRDYIDVSSQPEGQHILSPDELDQYRKNLDTRFAMGGQDMANIGQHFNFDKLNTTDDTKAALNAMANVVESHLADTVGGADRVRNWDEVKANAAKIADVIGTDPKLALQNLSNLAGNAEHLDAHMKANGDFLLSLSAHSDKLAQMIADGTHGTYGSMDNLKAAYANSTNMLSNTYALYKGVQTNVARAMNAAKISRSVNPAITDGLQKIDPADDQLLMRLAQRQAAASRGAADDLDAAASTRKLMEGSWFDKALAVHNEYWFNAVLSGMTSRIVHSTSTTVKAVFMPAEQMVAGLLSRNTPQYLEGAYQYVGMAKALGDAFQMAGKAFKVGDTILDNAQGMDGTINRHAITAQMFGQQDDSSIGSLINGIGTLVRIPSRMVMAQDEFSKQLTYRANIYASAMREGVEQGMNPDQTAALVQQRMAQAFDPNGHANLTDAGGNSVNKNMSAMNAARDATFTQPLDYGIGRWIEQGAQAHPAIRILMPFVRVPTNIMRDVWAHTPALGLVQKQMRDDIAAGGERASLAYAKQATGAALWATAAAAAYEGKITGYGPTDPQQRQAWLLQNQPYSFVHTDPDTGKKTFTSFSRLDPYGAPFGLAADFAQIAGQMSDGDKDTFAKGAVLALVNNLASKTYLEGLIQAVNIMSDNPQQKLDAYLRQRAASYIPNILGAANPDPYMREVRGVLDAMQNKIPGFSQNLPARRDILGEPMTIPQGYPMDHINPFVVKTVDTDTVRDEMARLASLDAGARFPMPSTKMDGLDLTKVKGDDGMSFYDKWMKAIGETTIDGRTLHDRLADTINSSGYQDAADGTATFTRSRKVDMIDRDLNLYRQRALHETLKDFPDLQTALRSYRIGVRRMRAGTDPQADPFAVFNQ